MGEREECPLTATKSLSSFNRLSLVIKADFGTLRTSSPLLILRAAPKPLLQHSPKPCHVIRKETHIYRCPLEDEYNTGNTKTEHKIGT